MWLFVTHIGRKSIQKTVKVHFRCNFVKIKCRTRSFYWRTKTNNVFGIIALFCNVKPHAYLIVQTHGFTFCEKYWFPHTKNNLFMCYSPEWHGSTLYSIKNKKRNSKVSYSKDKICTVFCVSFLPYNNN
jgi:hypothetical protein